MRIRSFDEDKAILYLVATPIGNLEDMTYRAVRILKSVDKIYAEDTRTSSYLLKYYDIHTAIESYHEYNQDLKSEQILKELNEGKKLALISDAGLPVISDPGYKIVCLAIQNNIAVSTVPGASAAVSALVSSGLAPMPYTFAGFLDAKKTKRIKQLENLKYLPYTLIFYEAPHRIKEMLTDVLDVLGDRAIVLARELTKSYEEFVRGKVSEVLQTLPLKGEMVVLVEGYEGPILQGDPCQKVDELILTGLKTSEAIKEAAKLFSLNKNELYQRYIDYKNNQ